MIHRIHITKVAGASAFLAALSLGIALSQTPAVATGDFDTCPVQGQGGDPDLNSQKNRSAMPTATAPMTVAQLEALQPVSQDDGKTRSAWPAGVQTTIQNQESQAVVFTGYIVKAIQEGAESCNCGLLDTRDHDVHIYIADDPDATPADAAIAEVTPRWRAVYPSWNVQNMNQLHDAGTEVRLTGWLLYDQEHWDMINKDERATLWEIHPITSVQVETPNGWVNLADYQFQ